MSSIDVTRRQAIGLSLGAGALLAGGVLGAGAGPAAAAAPNGTFRATLPGPTGPHPVGTVSLHLIDATRRVPWVPEHPLRELMITLWYPARAGHRYPRAPWLPAGSAEAFGLDGGFPPGTFRAPVTHGHDGAPVQGCLGRLPVVVFSTGKNGSRFGCTLICEELAGRGYLVVALDHPYCGLAVEFPDGTVIPAIPDATRDAHGIAAARVADTRFVLDALEVLDAGGNPDVDRHPLPAGLASAFDLSRVAMFGYSLGGGTVAASMYEDDRILAGLSLDGAVYGPVQSAGLDRPYLPLDLNKSSRAIPALAEFWSHLRGWRLNLRVEETKHISLGDEELIVPQAAAWLGWSAQQVADLIGTLRPERALAIQRAYPRAFFDLHLRHEGRLLAGPSPRFPEVRFLP
ncbi:alpha/beta hydrolase family protein [Embleya sp. AB8]|uniref:alpha/beta hydrolase family protein n=1 Tax=Embleya sp. AB8 TaxID=3156304 RepID=UPI003C75688E